jgi:hypothetical protein
VTPVITYACYRDGTDLTSNVEAARGAQAGPPVVFKLEAGLPSQESVDQRLAARAPTSPTVVEVDPTELGEDAAERAGQIVRMLKESPAAERTGEAPPDWSVLVTCPKDGCVNVFSSSTAAAEPGTVTKVVGHPPTMEEQALADASKELGPDKSLEHANDAAKFVITNITLVALVAGGFGIFGSANGGFDRHPFWYGAIVIAAAASLVSALVAVFPWVKSGRNYNNLLQVAEDYKQAIKHRANWARAATLFLALALLCALVVFLLPTTASPAAAITASWDDSGAALLLTAKVDATALPDDSRAEIDVLGLRAKGGSKPLSTSTGHSAKSGSLSVETKTPVGQAFVAYRVRSKISWGKRASGRFEDRRVDAVRLTPPPSAAPVSPPGNGGMGD